MKGPEKRFIRIAEQIADAQPVDWNAETGDEEDTSAKLRNLQTLERIRRLHQGEAHGPQESPTRALRPGERPASSGTGFRRGSTWGTLRLVEPVGRGAYGEVWRAWDESLQTHVALKLLIWRDQALEDVTNEARQMAKVRHENVVTVHGVAVHAGCVGIWSDFIRGKTLEEELADRGPLGAAEAAVVAKDLLQALAAVHAAGLVHRDLKTTNVMREERGRIVLMDFGTVVRSRDLESLAQEELFAGTADDMAPEIFRGARGGKQFDIYALGVVLYRLTSGRYPLEAKDLAALRRGHEREESIPLRDVRPDLPVGFVQVVERALAKPEARYASAGEMERDLTAFLAGVSADRGSDSEPELRVEPSRPAARQGRAWIAAAVALVAVGLWATWGNLGDAALDVEAALFRVRVGAEERLASGGRVQPGDQLFLELEAAKDVYAYVLDEDELGNAYLLFPLGGVEPNNPLAGGKTHRLPGHRDEVELTWDVDSYGGREMLYVIVSREPLEDLESELGNLPESGSAQPVPFPLESLRRGIGGLGTAPPSDVHVETPSLAGIFDDLSGEASGANNLWTWSIRLENPAP